MKIVKKKKKHAHPFYKCIRSLVVRHPTKGEQLADEWRHYGLATPIYTHFTSPIRRYADVVVHRLLGAALGLSALPAAVSDGSSLSALTETLNTRHRNAQQAGRASVELHTLLFFRGREVIADARVTRCRANGLIVFVPKYGIEGPVLFDAADADDAEPPRKRAKAAPGVASEWELSEDGCAVAHRGGGARFTLFDRVAVRLKVVSSAVAKRERLSVSLADLSDIKAEEVAKP